MKVDIYIKEVDGKREIRIPWLPDEIKYETGETSMASYDIIGKGNVAKPTGVGLATCSWESIFPGANRTDTSLLHGSWIKPETYQQTLIDWKKNKTKLNLLVVGYPINLSVYLTNFSSVPSGGFGDISYKISFTEAREVTVTSTTNTTNVKAAQRTAKKLTTYTVKDGDTLWSIALKQLGAGSRWEEIYDLNKGTIESIAKSRWRAAGVNRDSENGRWIFPGTKLRLKTER